MLGVKKPYGSLLYAFLLQADIIPKKVLEVGGGYGFLMRDFFMENPTLEACMWDISPAMVGKQKETLRGLPVSFFIRDVLCAPPASFSPFDLVIMNEMMGDLPTITSLTQEKILSLPLESENPLWEEAKRMILNYKFELPKTSCPFNIGALLALEKVCKGEVKTIFISEHSCEARVPASLEPLVNISAPGYPERIPLKGHTEYTIKFSYLEKVAKAFGYEIKRGPLADIIPYEMTDKLRICLRAPAPRTPEEEVLRQFISDLYQYEYLLLTKG